MVRDRARNQSHGPLFESIESPVVQRLPGEGFVSPVSFRCGKGFCHFAERVLDRPLRH